MRIGACIVAALVVSTAVMAIAQVQPTPGPGDPRIQTVEYRPNQVVRLAAALGYQLSVSLSPDEHIQTVAVGDAGAWQVSTNRAGDHLFVKLTQGGATTNMTVTTSVRQYVFELVALSMPSPDMAYTVEFRYPTPPAPQAAVQKAAVGNYKVRGARALWPSAISDDGERTFIEWPKNADLPAVYVLDGQRRETLINGLMRQDQLVIDSVASLLVFRVDRRVAYAQRIIPREPKNKRQTP